MPNFLFFVFELIEVDYGEKDAETEK